MSEPKPTWLDFIPPILAWLLIVAIPVGVGYTIYHFTAWPKAIAWLVGAFLFAFCLFLGEWLCRGLNLLFDLCRKKH